MNNTKTPVMVLQELAVAKEWILPEYTIVHAVEGTHDNIFHYQVAVHGEAAIGVGRSKKEAKHKAASLLLEKLSDVVDCNLRTQPSVPEKKLKLVNAVGILCDICGENKIPMPIFTQISDVGPPHCREFTYECQVATLVTRATASTKKQAKHWAAKEMTDRIMTALPDLITEYEDQKSSALAIDDRIKDEYAHAKLLKPKPNLSLQIEDRHMHLKNIATEKGLDSDCVQMVLL
uniref:DRBM domain-containing protein n=1 Tax=Photinus pyralis TaxID=7054 RepID=A0A1Y1N863_PHOPY